MNHNHKIIDDEINRISNILNNEGLISAEIELKTSKVPEIFWRGLDYRAELLLKSKEFFNLHNIDCQGLDDFVTNIRLNEAKGIFHAFDSMTEFESLKYLEWLEEISNWRQSSLRFCLSTGSTLELTDWIKKPPADISINEYPYHRRAWDIAVLIAILAMALFLWNIIP